MPRDGSGVFSKPAGTTAVANTTIESAKYNQTIDDLVTDANTPRPIVAGGTGASTAAGARTALGLAIGTNVQAQDANLQDLADNLTASAAELNLLDGVTAKTGADTALVTGTAGASGRVAEWNADGDLVDAGVALPGSAVAGDLLYASGANTYANLAKGTALQLLRMNAGASQPEWGDAPVQSPRLVSTTTLASAVDQVTITGLGGYRHIMCWTDADTSANDIRRLRVGHSGGILSTSIYVQKRGGEATNIVMHDGSASSNRSGLVTIYNFNTTEAVKPVSNPSNSSDDTTTAIDSALAFDRVQFLVTGFGITFNVGARFLVWGWN